MGCWILLLLCSLQQTVHHESERNEGQFLYIANLVVLYVSYFMMIKIEEYLVALGHEFQCVLYFICNMCKSAPDTFKLFYICYQSLFLYVCLEMFCQHNHPDVSYTLQIISSLVLI